MNYYLGIDIGTTSTKAIAFSETGKVIKQVAHSYEMSHPEKDQSEQDPLEILQAVINGINKVTSALLPHQPLFVSFSAAMHSLILLDAKDDLLTHCIIWADNRSNDIAKELQITETGKDFYNLTGVPIHPMAPLSKIVWFKENKPEIFRRTAKFIGIKEFVFYKLFNILKVDSSLASATGLLNLESLQWDSRILQFLGISPNNLSEVVSPKHVEYYNGYNAILNLRENVPLVLGASDGALSNVGMGAVGNNSLGITIGTSGATRMLLQGIELDKQMRTFCYHAFDQYYIVGGASNNGAVVLQWLKENILQTSDTYDELFKQAETIAAGSEELTFLPYLLGERAPIWNSEARGVYFGLHIDHTKAHLLRASIEGIIFSMYSIGKILIGKKDIQEIYAAGGFAKSSLGLQIMADVFNSKVIVSDVVESSALGAVKLGAEALGLPFSYKINSLFTYLPNPERHQIYITKFARFERLYDLLKGEMG